MAMTTEAVAVMAAATKNNTPKLSSASHPTDTKAAVTAIKMIVVFSCRCGIIGGEGTQAGNPALSPCLTAFPYAFGAYGKRFSFWGLS